jgi:hypothetical protein
LLVRLHLSERAYLDVSETVTVRRNSVHRDEYAYYLIIDGQEYWARDFDPIHGYHGHTIGHERIEAGRITFKRAVEEAWKILGEEEELAQDDPDENEQGGA